MTSTSTAPLWTDLTPKDFDQEVPDVQLGLFAVGSGGEMNDLFSMLDD